MNQVFKPFLWRFILVFKPFLRTREVYILSNLDSSSTAPRHLAIYWAFQLPLIAILIASRQLSGSIEISFGPSIAYRQLVDRLSYFLIFCWFVPRQILNSFFCWCLFAWHLSRHLYLSRFTGLLFKRKSRFPPHFSWSLYRLIFSPPKTLSLTPNLIPKCSSSFFKFFLFTW